MARDFGRVRARRGGKNGWEIDLGRGITPRFLYSARGARFESEKMAQAILDAIRVRIARGASPQQAVDEFAPSSSDRNRVSTWVERYIAEQEERTATLEISPNHLRELRRCARPDGTWSWWASASIHEIDAASLNEWRLWLATSRGLSPKSVRNNLGYFRAFVGWLFRLERIDRVPAFPIGQGPRSPAHDLEPPDSGSHSRSNSLGASRRVSRGSPRDPPRRAPRTRRRRLPTSRRRPRLEHLAGRQRPQRKRPDRRDEDRRRPLDPHRRGARGLDLLADRTARPTRRRSPPRRPRPSRGARPPVPEPDLAELGPSLDRERRYAKSGIPPLPTVGITVRMYEGTKHSAATGWRTSGMSLEMIQRMLQASRLSEHRALREAFRPGARPRLRKSAEAIGHVQSIRRGDELERTHGRRCPVCVPSLFALC